MLGSCIVHLMFEFTVKAYYEDIESIKYMLQMMILPMYL